MEVKEAYLYLNELVLTQADHGKNEKEMDIHLWILGDSWGILLINNSLQAIWPYETLLSQTSCRRKGHRNSISAIKLKNNFFHLCKQIKQIVSRDHHRAKDKI